MAGCVDGWVKANVAFISNAVEMLILYRRLYFVTATLVVVIVGRGYETLKIILINNPTLVKHNIVQKNANAQTFESRNSHLVTMYY